MTKDDIAFQMMDPEAWKINSQAKTRQDVVIRNAAGKLVPLNEQLAKVRTTIQKP